MNISFYFSKWIKPLLKPALYLFGASAVIVVIVMAVAWYLLTPDRDIFKSEKFDKKLWQEDVLANQLSNPKDCQRGRMTQHVIDTLRNAHLTKGEIIHMLGEPNSSNADVIQYDIGWCSYIDPNTLDIEFTENGYVGEAQIVNH